MRIFKIKNKCMYKCKDKKEARDVHFYAVYKDKDTKQYRAIQLTHVLEKEKETKVKKGQLILEKISCIGKKTLSGVKDAYYDKDINGKPLDFGRKSSAKQVGRVPTEQAKRIIDFAKKRNK